MTEACPRGLRLPGVARDEIPINPRRETQTFAPHVNRRGVLLLSARPHLCKRTPALAFQGRARLRILAARLLARQGDFREAMETLFKQPAAGRLAPPMLWDTAAQVRLLESRLNALEERVQHPAREVEPPPV
jgi:hypothetical protein